MGKQDVECLFISLQLSLWIGEFFILRYENYTTQLILVLNGQTKCWVVSVPLHIGFTISSVNWWVFILYLQLLQIYFNKQTNKQTNKQNIHVWKLYNPTDISFEWANKMLSGIGAFFMTPIIGFTISSVNCLVSWLQTWALST